MIISVHIQKTAGTSFRQSLKDLYGDKLFLKYGEGVFKLSKFERNKKAIISSQTNLNINYDGIECIHGHFLPIQYLLLSHKKPLTFITWFRDPVDRLISHYYHIIRNQGNNSNAFNQKVVKEEWSLEKYCLNERIQNFYGQIFWGFPLEYFDFIGVTEHYEKDLIYFSQKYLNTNTKSFKLNVNKKSKSSLTISKSLRQRIEIFHQKDMELYQRVLKKRENRLSDANFRNHAV